MMCPLAVPLDVLELVVPVKLVVSTRDPNFRTGGVFCGAQAWQQWYRPYCLPRALQDTRAPNGAMVRDQGDRSFHSSIHAHLLRMSLVTMTATDADCMF